MSSNLRAQAARCLAPVIRRQGSMSELFDSAIEKVIERDRALFHELCYGTLRHYFSLQAIAGLLLDKKPRGKDSDVWALVLIGLHQILHMRIPDHAAISESVAAAKALKKPWAKGLLNASLRRFLREKDSLINTLESNEEHQYAHPQWLIDQIKKAWPEHYAEILKANNEVAPVCLRVNTCEISRQDFLEALRAQGRSAIELNNRQGLRLEQSHNIQTLPGYESGWFAVQDEAAQFCADLLQAQNGEYVLDACAAPGGKSAHLLESADIELCCVELEPKRMQRVEENLKRLKHSAKLIVADASEPEKWWDGRQFDRILLDAPCSATGVIRRHPDIKLLRREADIVELVQLQQQILSALWPCLKPGGHLLYATCSVLAQENDEQIRHFLARNADAKACQLAAFDQGVQTHFGHQLLPTIGGCDGFYFSLLSK